MTTGQLVLAKIRPTPAYENRTLVSLRLKPVYDPLSEKDRGDLSESQFQVILVLGEYCKPLEARLLPLAKYFNMSPVAIRLGLLLSGDVYSNVLQVLSKYVSSKAVIVVERIGKNIIFDVKIGELAMEGGRPYHELVRIPLEALSEYFE